MPKIVAIVGPTGIGKSQLAIELAELFEGEIINADSRQIYRYLDIGTAKTPAGNRKAVVHHLVDIIDPDARFSLAEYQDLAYSCIDQVHGCKKLPILAGGSGQYVWAILEGWNIPRVGPQEGLRKRLESRVLQGNAPDIYTELKAIDPVAAEKIDPRNTRRLIRALEVAHNGKAARDEPNCPRYESLVIGLTATREVVYSRIDQRVDHMLEAGLIEEVASLKSRGYGLDIPSMSSIGYRQIGRYLSGEISLEKAIQQIKYESHRLVRVQYNWFGLHDRRIKWFDIVRPGYGNEINTLVKGFLGN